MLTAIPQHFSRKAAAIHSGISQNLPGLMMAWLVIALLGGSMRLLAGGVGAGAIGFSSALPYILLMAAPLVSMGLALRWFENGPALPQPAIRLARVGKWREVSLHEAKRHKLFGSTGLMVSLLVGMLFNVLFRAGEYWLAMPALTGAVPQWLGTLHFLMTLDVIVMSSLYVIAFVAALKAVPLFPRLLVAIWLIDITLQILTAHVVVTTDLPASVASSLHPLIDANIKKVFISMTIWLPYLLLSKRVNVTYRHRVPA